MVDKAPETVKKIVYYCAQCKSKVQESDIKCQKCKNLLAADGAVIKKEINVSLKKDNEIERNELVGVKGWLLYFCALLLARSIFSGIITLSLGVYLISLFFNFNVITFIITLIALLSFGLLTYFRFYTWNSLNELRPNAYWLAKFEALISFRLILLIYLYESQRVKNTYPEEKRKSYFKDKRLVLIIVIFFVLLISLCAIFSQFLNL